MWKRCQELSSGEVVGNLARADARGGLNGFHVVLHEAARFLALGYDSRSLRQGHQIAGSYDLAGFRVGAGLCSGWSWPSCSGSWFPDDRWAAIVPSKPTDHSGAHRGGGCQVPGGIVSLSPVLPLTAGWPCVGYAARFTSASAAGSATTSSVPCRPRPGGLPGRQSPIALARALDLHAGPDCLRRVGVQCSQVAKWAQAFRQQGRTHLGKGGYGRNFR